MSKQQIRPFNDDVYLILQKAGQYSQKYYHTYIGTAHTFLATFAFLSSQKETQKYGKIYETLKGLLNEVGINGPEFEKNFLLASPRGEEPSENEEFSITADIEYKRVTDGLTRKAFEEKRSMEVEDLIVELFADKSFVLFSIFSMVTGSDQITENLYNTIVKAFKREKKPVSNDLDKIPELTNLNRFVEENPQTIIGAEKVLNQLFPVLCGRVNPNALLIGPAGTGKTTFVYALAQAINRGEVPAGLRNKRIFQLDPTALVSGTRYRGDFEEKLTNIIKLVKADPDAIVFVDEAHGLISLGDNEGANAAGNIFKPFLSRGDIQMILATTNEEFTKFMEKQHAFVRRFHKVLVEEPTEEETKQILRGLIEVEQKFFNKEMKEELVDRIVKLSSQYTLDQANPAKALNLLDFAFAYSKVFKEDASEVNIDDIIESIKLKHNIFVSENKFETTKKELNGFLLGQEKPLERVCKNLKMVDQGLSEPGKPLCSLLLAGPSGVGKTQTAKLIAKYYFGDEEKNLIKINMGEYSDQTSVSKLCGASAGYVGYDDEPYLLKQIKQYPNSVILFDEIEKAHRDVYKVLLNILDAGEMTDNKGTRVSFRNSIILFTTNLGYDLKFAEEKGLGFIKTKGESHDIMKSIEKHFAPEFIGRLDDIIVYNNLTDEIANTLIERYLKEYANNSDAAKLVKFNKADIDEIVNRARIKETGARSLKKAVKYQISEVIDRMTSKNNKKGNK